MKIVITAGHNKSMHTIALMHDLIKNGHEITGCIQVRTFQLKRLKSYLKQYGLETVKAKYRSHVLGSKNTYLENETKLIKEYLKNNNIHDYKTTYFCRKAGIKHITTNSINDIKIEQFIKRNNIDLVVYAGGGIVRKNIIGSSKYGVLNAHSGFLPFFRGMNVIEWSLLYGFLPHTTIHLIDTGIDTGRIIYSEPIPFSADLYSYRGNATVHNVKLLVTIINNFQAYRNEAAEQKETDGKQFFVMHKRLKTIVAAYLIRCNSDLSQLKTNISNELKFS
ncbi:hypothetical protein FACS189450_12920 [Spirochaetia bacterium]|nr:hypothetical protein FACS189450_12920 [Spirochaetia bacterium]